jgi:hypothetical protein
MKEATTRCQHLDEKDSARVATVSLETAESPARAKAPSLHLTHPVTEMLWALVSVPEEFPAARPDWFAALPVVLAAVA